METEKAYLSSEKTAHIDYDLKRKARDCHTVEISSRSKHPAGQVPHICGNRSKGCVCQEPVWMKSRLIDPEVKEDTESQNKANYPNENHVYLYNISNIRSPGPCGKIGDDVDTFYRPKSIEDDIDIDLESLVGPCGSKQCPLSKKIKDFIQCLSLKNKQKGLRKGQCSCLEQLKKFLLTVDSLSNFPSQEQKSGIAETCRIQGYKAMDAFKGTNDVYYCTVQQDPLRNKAKPKNRIDMDSLNNPSIQFLCPASSKSTVVEKRKDGSDCSSYNHPPEATYPLSPDDSDFQISLEEIHSACCKGSIEFADEVKQFLTASIARKNNSVTPC